MSEIGIITVPLGPPYPEGGMATTICRLSNHDKLVFDAAAAHMGMSRSTLMRLLLVRGSERILRELGVVLEYEPSGERVIGKAS